MAIIVFVLCQVDCSEPIITVNLIKFYVRTGNPRPTNLPVFEHYFASKSELRKLKLERLKNGRGSLL